MTLGLVSFLVEYLTDALAGHPKLFSKSHLHTRNHLVVVYEVADGYPHLPDSLWVTLPVVCHDCNARVRPFLTETRMCGELYSVQLHAHGPV